MSRLSWNPQEQSISQAIEGKDMHLLSCTVQYMYEGAGLTDLPEFPRHMCISSKVGYGRVEDSKVFHSQLLGNDRPAPLIDDG